MMSLSGGLNPKAVAGGPSVTRLTQRSWTGMRPAGTPKAVVKNMEFLPAWKAFSDKD